MTTIPEALAVAIEHHQHGRLNAAEQLYCQILAADPKHAEAWHLLGMVASQVGQYKIAIEYMERAIGLHGTAAHFHNNLGEAYRVVGRTAEAVACYRRALELQPDFAEAHYNLGNMLKDSAQWDDAVFSYRRAIALKPDFAAAYNNLGVTLKEQHNLPEAINCYRRALELKPELAASYCNLGVALNEQGNVQESVGCYRRALELMPDLAEAHSNLGNSLKEQGELSEAIACYRQALILNSDYADAHWNLAMVMLLLGDFRRGWEEYEWRFKKKTFVPLQTDHPQWDGHSLDGTTILLHSEQGLGDTIQFVRFVPWVKARGGTVILECQKPLLPLLADFAADRVVEQGPEPPAFEVQASLLSLPRIFKVDFDNIPAEIPYLFASPLLVDRWREKLRGTDGFRVGIAWQGSLEFPLDRYRSTPLRHFAALAANPDVRLISLQKGPGTDQLAEVRDLFPVMDLSGELDVDSGPFMDTAAIMMNLDLVVTVDTAIAHLAGALGVPVWVALPLVPDWRWFLDRDDSPWYPTMRLFRQRSFGDWAGVFGEMQSALQRSGGTP